MKAVYLNNEDEQITFNGSMQEVTSKELKEMLEMIKVYVNTEILWKRL